jgi:hypothetical protein
MQCDTPLKSAQGLIEEDEVCAEQIWANFELFCAFPLLLPNEHCAEHSLR